MSGQKRVWVRDRSANTAALQQEFDDNFSYPIAGTMCSGSRQPTADELKKIIEHIRNNKKADFIVIIDLRDEFHFHCDFGPIGLENINAESRVVAAEYNKDAELDSQKRLIISNEIEIYVKHKEIKAPDNFSSIMLSPGKVKTEEELVISLGAIYQRFPVTDHGIPNPELIDQFVMFAHNLPANTWVHFHCHGGKGRTSTFMAMYNLLYFTKNIAAMPADYDAMNHPKLKTKEDRRTSAEQLNRISFMKNFKLYVNSYAEAINLEKAPPLWSEWQKQKGEHHMIFLQSHIPLDAVKLQIDQLSI